MEGTLFSLVPPLTAIVLCIWVRQPVLALFVGIYVGAMFLFDFAPVSALFRTFDDIMLASLIDGDHVVIFLFTMFMGGQVEVFNRSGAAQRFVRSFAARIATRRHCNTAIWASGFLFFIDDYANALIIGNAYQRIVDALKISREKLAYLVDTTSAPIASLAVVSTWIGFEISVIDGALESSGGEEYSGFELFITSIVYRFYPLLALFFAYLICRTGRDFGPMVEAERNALQRTTVAPPGETDTQIGEFRWREFSTLAPFAFLLGAAVVMLIMSGLQNAEPVEEQTAWQAAIHVISAADPFRSLLHASILASLLSVLLHGFVLREGLVEAFTRWLDGIKGMFIICVILTLAWSIGDVCQRMETGAYVAGLLTEGFPAYFLPLFTFLFAAGISFATGTSYGTMAILMPIALPIALELHGGNPDILYGTVGSVLGGAIFGDHCSPLSDTTILSSGASGCGLIEHVRTQMPYALAVAAVSVLCLLLLPLPFTPALLVCVAGAALLAVILRAVGTPGAPE